MGCGIVPYYMLKSEPNIISVISLYGSLFLLWIYSLRRSAFSVKLAMTIAFLVMTGFSAATVRTHTVYAAQITKETKAVMMSGTIHTIEIVGKARRVVLSDLEIENFDPAKTPKRVRLQSYHIDDAIPVGSRITVRGVLRPPPPPVMPGAFDFQRTLFFDRIGATGYTIAAPVEVTPPDGSGVLNAINQTRLDISRTALDVLGARTGSVATALMTGQRKAMPDDIAESFRDAGLSHLLSISGLHVGLVAGFIFVLIRLLLCLNTHIALHYPIKKVAAVFALIGAFFYLLLAGAPVPTQRAFIMTALVLVAVLLDRRGISLRLVMLAAFILLLFTPEKILHPSFQMSFAAVIGLVSIYEFWRRKSYQKGRALTRTRKAMIFLGGVILSTLVAELATLSFGLHHFNRVTTYNVIANMVAMPIVTVWVMPFVVINLIITPFFPSLAELTLIPMGWGIDAIIWVSLTVTSWDGAFFLTPPLPGYGVFIASVGFLWLCLWKGSWRWWGIPIFIVGFLPLFFQTVPDVLINENGKLMGVQAVDGSVYLSATRREKFTARIWKDRYRVTEATAFADGFETTHEFLKCDELGCVYTRDEVIIAFPSSYEGILEDCSRADVIVTALYVGGLCKNAAYNPQIIDKKQLKRRGSHAVYLDGNHITVISDRDTRGRRAWMPYVQLGERSNYKQHYHSNNSD